MPTKRILFATDFSRASDAGLEYATALARDLDALLLVIHVEEAPLAYAGGHMYYGVPDPNHEHLLQMLKAVVPKDPQVRYEHRMIAGAPAEAIVELARVEQADLIVIGTHGRTGLARLLMGSVAEVVVRHAPCPVFTFKLPHEELQPAARNVAAAAPPVP